MATELRLEQFDSELPGFFVYRDGQRASGPLPYARARRLALSLAGGEGEAVEVKPDGTRIALDGRVPSEPEGGPDPLEFTDSPTSGAEIGVA